MSSVEEHAETRCNTASRASTGWTGGTNGAAAVSPVTSLEHRRDVGSLVMCHKTQVQRVSHLDRLRLPRRSTQRCTRNTSDRLLEVPRFQTRQQQRTYTARSSGLRNMFTAATPQVLDMSTHQVKLAAHRWRETHPSALVLPT